MVLTRPWLCALAAVAGCSTAVRTSAPAPACLADCAAEAQAASPPAPTAPAPDPPIAPTPAEPAADDGSDAASPPAASTALGPLLSPQAGVTGPLGGLISPAPSGGLGGRRGAAPRVTVGVPTVGPAMSAAAIRRVILRRRMPLRSCYERALATKPTLAGPVRIRFVIGPAGAVTAADVATGLDPTVDACLASVLRKTTFPAPSGGGAIIVTYPFTFGRATGP